MWIWSCHQVKLNQLHKKQDRYLLWFLARRVNKKRCDWTSANVCFSVQAQQLSKLVIPDASAAGLTAAGCIQRKPCAHLIFVTETPVDKCLSRHKTFYLLVDINVCKLDAPVLTNKQTNCTFWKEKLSNLACGEN